MDQSRKERKVWEIKNSKKIHKAEICASIRCQGTNTKIQHVLHHNVGRIVRLLVCRPGKAHNFKGIPGYHECKIMSDLKFCSAQNGTLSYSALVLLSLSDLSAVSCIFCEPPLSYLGYCKDSVFHWLLWVMGQVSCMRFYGKHVHPLKLGALARIVKQTERTGNWKCRTRERQEASKNKEQTTQKTSKNGVHARLFWAPFVCLRP